MISHRDGKFVLAVGVLLQVFSAYAQTGCKLSYKTDLADKEPVLLTNAKFGYELYHPTNPEISLKPKEEIIISCPGANNKISGANKDTVTAKCEQGNKVSIDGKQTEFNKISCEKRPTGQHLDTSEPCGTTGIRKYIGHKLADKWYTLFDLCYDHKKGQTIYAKHTLQGAAIDHDKQDKIDGSSKIGGLEFRVKPEQVYTQANLKKIFTNLLGTQQIAEQYINAQSVLAKGQLAPKSDFVFTTSQYASHFYINTVPQWKSINSGNWKILEDAIRKTASNLGENFKIITGSHDVLTLKNKNGIETKMYLDDGNTLPIPKFIWKIVYAPKTKKAIVFVSFNSPFGKSVVASDYLCNDVCDKYGWANSLWKQPAKGLVYCCDVKQFLEKVKNAPNVGDITGVLDGKTTGAKPPTVQNPGGCLLSYKTDFPEKQPILLRKTAQNYALLEPQIDGVSLKPQEEIVLFCPGGSNKITKLNKNLVAVQCASGKLLKSDGKQFNFKDLGCTQKVNTEFKLSKIECGGQGLLKQIGHKLDDKNFLSLVTVCYDHKQGATLYSEHVLHGNAINSAKIVDQAIDYKVAGLDFRVNAEEDYKIANQKTIFEKLLETTKYINTHSFLAKGHLIPSADFVFSSSKYASFFYINTLPQWQIINNGNWKSVENAIRTTASVLKKPFEIITGGYETLNLKNAKGKDVEIYLDVLQTLPVPKFIWKIMYSLETKKGVAFISLNNPFVDSVKKEDYICPNVCKKYGWGSDEWEKKDKGMVYCCEIKEFLKVVNPNLELATIQGVQEAKKK